MNTWPFRIERRPLLIPGGIWSEPGQRAQTAIVLYLDDSLDRGELLVTLWHETVHLLMGAAGVPLEEHDEATIEAAAQKLAAACPEIVELRRLAQDSGR